MSFKSIINTSGGAGNVNSITGTPNEVLANGTSGVPQTGAVTLTLAGGDLGSMAYQNANAVAITGGTIDNTPIGNTTPTTGKFTTLTASTKLITQLIEAINSGATFNLPFNVSIVNFGGNGLVQALAFQSTQTAPGAASLIGDNIAAYTGSGTNTFLDHAAFSSGKNVTMNQLTASQLVVTDGSKILSSIPYAAGIATFLATPTSANLAAAVTNETGSGALVFGTNATLVNPFLTGAPSVGTVGTRATTVYYTGTGSGNFVNFIGADTSQVGNFDLTFPVLSGADVLALVSGAQTISNKTLSSVVSLQFAGANQTALSKVYEQPALSCSPTGAWSPTFNVYFTQIGRQVFMTWPDSTTGSATAATLMASGFVPAAYRPAGTIDFPYCGQNAGVNSGALCLQVAGNGDVTWNAPNFSAFTGALPAAIYKGCVTWTIGV